MNTNNSLNYNYGGWGSDFEIKYDDRGCNSCEYNNDGYNKFGYDKDGYGKDGLHKDGYNEHGYDKNGYDKNGYDMDGDDDGGYNILAECKYCIRCPCRCLDD